MVKRIIASFLLLLLPVAGFASGASIPLMRADNDVSDKVSLATRRSIFRQLLPQLPQCKVHALQPHGG